MSSLIKHSERKNTHGGKTSAIKAAVANYQETTSFESSSFTATGHEAAGVIDGAITTLIGVLEPSTTTSFESAVNKTGLELAAFVLALGEDSIDYMAGYSKESKAPKGTLGALTLQQGFESVYSAESFDNQVLDKYRGISIAVNYALGKQGPSMEAMYRTVAVTPDTAGVEVDFANLLVQNVLERDLSGNPQDFGYRRLVDAYIDSSMLSDDAVRLIPSYTDATKHNFVDVAECAPFTRTIGNRAVLTNFLKVNHETDLIAIGHLDKASRTGIPDFTDALDRSMGIELLLQEIAGSYIQWNVLNQPGSRFVPSAEQGAKRMILDHNLRTLTLDKSAVAADGTPLAGAAMDLIRSLDLKVRLKITINGETDTEKAGTAINPGSVQVAAIFGRDGRPLVFSGPAADPALAPIVDMVTGSKIVGYFPDARLTNSNNRHLGMMLAHRATREILVTKTRAPFFYAYPKNETRDDTPADHLSVAVAAYTHNEALKHMVGVHDRIMKQTGGMAGELTQGNYEDNLLMIEGIGRNLTNPYVQHLEIDLSTMQSLETITNIENAQEVVLNNLRRVAFDIRQKTGYEAAARMIDNGSQGKWKFCLVASENVRNLMTIKGDSRDLGAGVQYVIHGDTSDLLYKTGENGYDSIYMGIIRETDGIDILSNGVCLQSPTMVTHVTSWRGGKMAEELMVQPRFNHYQLNTILVRFDVKGVSELLSKLSPFSVAVQPCDKDTGGSNPGTGTGPVVPGPGAGADDGSGTTGP